MQQVSTDFLKQYFDIRSPLTEQEWDLVNSKFKIIHCRKGDLLLHPGQVCSWICFNPNGVFRFYAIDDKGNEKNFLFKLEGSFFADYESFIHQRPAKYYIECIKESHLIALDYVSTTEIYEKVPAFQKIGRLVAEELYVLTKERVEDFMLLNAEERYLKLIRKHPEVFEKIPLGYIAEYLNVRPQSLSRIRKRIVFHG